MRIGSLNNNVSFRQIKMDGDSYWDLRNNASAEEVESIKNMSLKGFNHGYIVFDPDWGRYGSCLLKGIGSQTGKQLCIPLGEKPTAENVKKVINNYNRLA